MRTARSTYYLSLPTDGSDCHAIIQKAIDLVSNSVVYREVQLPKGTYYVSNPLLISRVKNGQYQQVTCSIRGAGYAKNTNQCTTLVFDNADFGIGIQCGRSCVVSDISIVGSLVKTGKRYSPQAGVVIDPYAEARLDEGYSGNYLPSQATSTCDVKGVSFHGWEVCYMNSPNGITQMGEMCNVYDVTIGYCVYGLVSGQDQNKQNEWRNIQAWSKCDALFSDRLGRGIGGHIVINGFNVAGGQVKRIFDWHGGRFPLVVRDGFGEMVYKIGDFTAGMVKIHDSHFDFINHGLGKKMPVPDVIIWSGGHGVELIDCVFRTYSEEQLCYSYRIKCVGPIEYTRCMFNAEPITYWQNPNDTPKISKFYGSKYYYDSKPKNNRPTGDWVTDVLVDKDTWNAYLNVPCNVGDYIIVKQGANPIMLEGKDYPDPTFILGRVIEPGKVYFLQSNCPDELININIEVIEDGSQG